MTAAILYGNSECTVSIIYRKRVQKMHSPDIGCKKLHFDKNTFLCVYSSVFTGGSMELLPSAPPDSSGMKFNDAEFIQYLLPVGRGPSSKM